MRAILIDDERHALLQLKWRLEKEPDIEVTGAYQTAEEGLSHLANERAEIVFLDMEMPGMSGLEAAEALRSLDKTIRVIFVTAYANYALEAFGVNALDYVLKPIDPARFSRTLERLRESVGPLAPARQDKHERLEAEMFGQLSIVEPGGRRAVKWRTLKAKELFAYLLQHRGVWLPRDILMEEIWPAFDLDKALVHLHTAVYQVRRILRETGIAATLEFSLESYRLHGDQLVTDADRLQQAADAAAEGKLSNSEAAAAWERYRGHYLDKEDYHWAKARREKLLQGYMVLTLQLTAAERAAGAAGSALRRARRACELHPYSERLAKELLDCLSESGEAEELRRSYISFCELFEEEWGAEAAAAFRTYGQRLLDRSVVDEEAAAAPRNG